MKTTISNQNLMGEFKDLIKISVKPTEILENKLRAFFK